MSFSFIVAHTTFTFSYWTASGKMFVQACCHGLQRPTKHLDSKMRATTREGHDRNTF